MGYTDKIFIAGHNGIVGSAIHRALLKKGYSNIITISSAELDLRNQKLVNDFFQNEKPQFVFDSAARVGGIMANNNYPYQFLMDNLLIQNNLMNAALENDVEKFIFLGSSCVYPKMCPQPIKEEYLLSSALEPTNEWYALAKIAGIKTCEAIRKQFNRNFICLMPTNTYGIKDNFDLQTSHVLPAMIRKFHEAKVKSNEPVTLWGNGSALREFIYVEDLADGIIFAFEKNLSDHIYNIGTGADITIRELSSIIQKVVGHEGEIIWDSSKPNGTPRKVLEVSKMRNEGWTATTNLIEGVTETYNWFLENVHHLREMKL